MASLTLSDGSWFLEAVEHHFAQLVASGRLLGLLGKQPPFRRPPLDLACLPSDGSVCDTFLPRGDFLTIFAGDMINQSIQAIVQKILTFGIMAFKSS